MHNTYIETMKRLSFSFVLVAALAVPAGAEEPEDNGSSLMERGAEMFLEGLLREIEPTLDDLQGMAEGIEPALREFVQEMGPAFADLLGRIDNLSNYHPPEMLPNGDIILRRKTPLEIVPDDGEEIEI